MKICDYDTSHHTRQDLVLEEPHGRQGLSQWSQPSGEDPKEFEIDAETVLMSKHQDGTLHRRPAPRPRSLLEVLDWLKEQGPIEDFPRDLGYVDPPPLDDIEL